MELREFAEQVLFATTLEEKLRRPGELTDVRPGPALGVPGVPGRPAGLGFKEARGGAAGGAGEFPGLHGLGTERGRGQVLHFFANHELLATELMALVLLRFPDAPAAFRRGVLRTLQEEQEHTRLYLERLRACGVEFGELPVSGYFWRMVSGMQSPLDYVAGLSLTFEQANLDYARQFGRGFAEAGDADTARLLERIYRDEIGHVAYGLKWFRRWKAPGRSDWEAYCAQLPSPLSPRRAKGANWNPEGRRAAGLDAEFIAQLNVYARSKGRTPGVFVFNPFAEGYLAQGRGFTPVRHQALLMADLANLPQFLGRTDDVVLVPRRPSVAHLDSLQQAGFSLPEFIELEEGRVPWAAGAGLAGRKLGPLHPWAWGPDSVALLEPLYGAASGGLRPDAAWVRGRLAPLYSKAWSAAFLREFLSGRAEPWLGGVEEAGVEARSLEEALGAVETLRRRGEGRVVVKQALGLAGHNALRLWEPELLEAQRRWMAEAVRRGPVVVEPWRERVLDFSVHFEMTPRALEWRGYAGLRCDARGQYRGNWAEPGHAKRPPAAVAALLAAPPDVALRVARLHEELRRGLEPRLREAGHLGPVGVDAFLFREASGRVRLKPVVEMNPRYTMGRLTLELMARACPGRVGEFRLLTLAQVRAAGAADFPSYAAEARRRCPVRLEGSPVPRLAEGVVFLNDPATAQAVLAEWTVTARAGSSPG
ncbi:MAG: hypothetical protein RJA22_826 [Verrucomicrobiota bacterium]|jgi:uncharacterized ferritin-like protein (DUF455 family)